MYHDKTASFYTPHATFGRHGRVSVQAASFAVSVRYAMTGNRGQGQTIERFGLYLPNPFFAHGQLYVAFSRIRNKANIKVLMRDTATQGIMTINQRHFFTKNASPLLPAQPVMRLNDLPNAYQLQQANVELDEK